ncbi:hypothetical protein M0813_16195 [Anaeramoeba flamelloides]|uniref:Uncharacterized protein n=1 Tax=Anaeramoeba flamelloides TaxID=1746091 RepID=A0ABQ8Z081_9EUKA|nr:hypothetical protein M0813_16195 [Anaeramoeba flamelloides]
MTSLSSTDEQMTSSNSRMEALSQNPQQKSHEIDIKELEESVIDTFYGIYPDFEKIMDIKEYFKQNKEEFGKEHHDKIQQLDEKITNLKKRYQENGKECTENIAKLMKSFSKKEEFLEEQLHRRLISLEDVKEMRDSLILENLKLKKKVSTLKKQMTKQQIESENSKQESEQEKKKILLKRNWLNHINVVPLKNSIKQFLKTNKQGVICAEYEYDLSWNFHDKVPFKFHEENRESEDPLIRSSIPSLLGGTGKAPSALQLFGVGVIAEFAR